MCFSLSQCTYFDDFHANSVECSACQSKQTKITEIGAFHEHAQQTAYLTKEKHGKAKVKIMNFLLFIWIIIAMRHFQIGSTRLDSVFRARDSGIAVDAQMRKTKQTECLQRLEKQYRMHCQLAGKHEIKLHCHTLKARFFLSSSS